MSVYDMLPPVEYGPEVSRAEYTIREHAIEHAAILAAYGLDVAFLTVRRDDDPFCPHIAYIVEVTR